MGVKICEMSIVVNVDALAQASDVLIERSYVIYFIMQHVCKNQLDV